MYRFDCEYDCYIHEPQLIMPSMNSLGVLYIVVHDTTTLALPDYCMHGVDCINGLLGLGTD